MKRGIVLLLLMTLGLIPALGLANDVPTDAGCAASGDNAVWLAQSDWYSRNSRDFDRGAVCVRLFGHTVLYAGGEISTEAAATQPGPCGSIVVADQQPSDPDGPSGYPLAGDPNWGGYHCD